MEKKENWTGRIWGILIGLIVAYALTLIGILILAFALYQWNMSVGTAEIGILVLYSLSCLIGGMIAGKKAESRKFLWGLFVGICYFLIVLLLSMTGEAGIVLGFQEVILPAIICVFSGMLGGMLV